MYKVNLHKNIRKDLKELGHRVSTLVLNKLNKISRNPLAGDKLGNKANLDLSGLRKVYVDNKRIRIVYKIIDDRIEVFVVVVGKRDDMKVYKEASKRIEEGKTI